MSNSEEDRGSNQIHSVESTHPEEKPYDGKNHVCNVQKPSCLSEPLLLTEEYNKELSSSNKTKNQNS